MTLSRSAVTKATGLLALVAGAAAFALVGCPSGGVGDPCTPEDEYRENFAGFKLSEENIESRSFQCKTRICLVNHFQGRVDCPNGQETPVNCTAQGTPCPSGEICVAGGVILTDCDPTSCDDAGANPSNCNDQNGNNAACGGRQCNQAGRFCHCAVSECPDNYFCNDETNLCTTNVCTPETADPDTRCYIPGTTDPVAVSVCGQCGGRKSDIAVYCSCRCGSPTENASELDEDFNFCDCPDGYTCEEIRKNVGLGDAQVAGKYCVKEGTRYVDEASCGDVKGFWAPQCNGTPAADPGG